MEKVLSFSINTHFIKGMDKIPKFANDMISNCKELEKESSIVLNENVLLHLLKGFQ